MAAITTLLLGTWRAGDHVVISDVVYGGVTIYLTENDSASDTSLQFLIEGLQVGTIAGHIDAYRPFIVSEWR